MFGDVDPHDPLFYADIAEPQSLNKYHYALNNPLRYIDPDGHQTAQADALKAGVILELIPHPVTKIAGAVIIAGVVGYEVYDHREEIKAAAQAGGGIFLEATKGSAPGCLAGTCGSLTFNKDSAAPAEADKKSDSKPTAKSQDFTPSDKRRIDSKTSGNCADCGRETESIQNKKGVPTPANQRQRHHDPPKSQGGTRDSEKNVLLCPGCHKERHRQIREIEADRKRQP